MWNRYPPQTPADPIPKVGKWYLVNDWPQDSDLRSKKARFIGDQPGFPPFVDENLQPASLICTFWKELPPAMAIRQGVADNLSSLLTVLKAFFK